MGTPIEHADDMDFLGLHGIACVGAVTLLTREDPDFVYTWWGTFPSSSDGLASGWSSLYDWLAQRPGHEIAVFMATQTPAGERLAPAHRYRVSDLYDVGIAEGIDLDDCFGPSWREAAGCSAAVIALDLDARRMPA